MESLKDPFQVAVEVHEVNIVDEDVTSDEVFSVLPILEGQKCAV